MNKFKYDQTLPLDLCKIIFSFIEAEIYYFKPGFIETKLYISNHQ